MRPRATMSAMAHTARIHAWFVNEDGRETIVTRRDDGRFYLNTYGAEDPIRYVSTQEAAEAIAEAKEAGREHGWRKGVEGGQTFDSLVAPTLGD